MLVLLPGGTGTRLECFPFHFHVLLSGGLGLGHARVLLVLEGQQWCFSIHLCHWGRPNFCGSAVDWMSPNFPGPTGLSILREDASVLQVWAMGRLSVRKRYAACLSR